MIVALASYTSPISLVCTRCTRMSAFCVIVSSLGVEWAAVVWGSVTADLTPEDGPSGAVCGEGGAGKERILGCIGDRCFLSESMVA